MSPAEKNSRPRAGPVRAALPIEHRERRQISSTETTTDNYSAQLPVVQRYSPPAPQEYRNASPGSLHQSKT